MQLKMKLDRRKRKCLSYKYYSSLLNISIWSQLSSDSPMTFQSFVLSFWTYKAIIEYASKLYYNKLYSMPN